MVVADDDHVSFVVWHVYRIPIVLGILSLLFIVVSITIYIKSYQSALPIQFSSDMKEASASTQGSEKNTVIFVDIEGAVKQPGVYQMPYDSRVEDVLIIAGGFSSAVDRVALGRLINRAAKVTDGAKIYIPSIDDAHVSSGIQAPSDRPVGLTQINTASQLELESLPGVGEVTAGNIIHNRPYMRLEELIEKNVIGQSLFEKLKDRLSL